MTEISKIDDVVLDLIEKHPEKAELAQSKPAVVGWFVGHVMRRLNGDADPAIVHYRVVGYLKA